MYKKSAFTLAEIVLVIGIIGVISVITIFNSRAETDTSARVAQLRKVYSELNSAYLQAISEDGVPNLWSNYEYLQDYELAEKHIFSRLKIKKNCKGNGGCWKDKNIDRAGQNALFTGNLNSSINDIATAKMSDGASIAMKINTNVLMGNAILGYLEKFIGYAIVDVDGPEHGPTTFGIDVFSFLLTIEDGMIPVGYNVPINNNSEAICPKSGGSCTAWVIDKGNMDYLKCANDLSWTDNKKFACKQ